jgi:hypothetical protein
MSGIKILKRLLMKEEMKKNAPFQNEGIMSISKALTTNIDSKVNRIVEGAKKQGIDFDQYNEQQVKYILELNKPKIQPRAIPADSPEGRGITRALLGRKEGKVIKTDFGKSFTKERSLEEKMVDDAIDNSSPGFSGDAKYDAQLVADDLADKMYGKDFYDLSQKQQMDLYDKAYTGLSKQRFKGMRKPKDDDPEDMATGGRAGFRIGSIDKKRRAFLKFLGGAGAGIAALKAGVLKMFGKEGAKNIPQVVTTPPIKGKPEWFDSLVNKVIAEGDDVTKKLATKEREIVHIKKIDEDSTVTVTRDLDEGIVRVEYDSPDNVFEDTVQLQYKKPLPDEVNPNPAAKFDVAESGPVGRSVGPDDFEIDVDEVGGTSIRDLDSDVSKLKEYATGKKLTMKEIAEAKRRRDKALAISEDTDGAQLDAVTTRQGDYVPEPDDFSSGGIARLLGE